MVQKVEGRAFLTALFEAAVSAAQPAAVMGAYLPPKPAGRTIVVGAGKASAQMGQALEKLWHAPLEGLIVTQYGCAAPCAHIEIVEAAHPVPDAAGFDAARRIAELVASAGADDLVIALISGGGSSLLPAPAVGLSLQDEQAINEMLLASGAPISDMNCVRKMFSTIKGGRLATMAAPAPICSLILSDVPGDDPAFVASGPTVADMNGLDEARAIIQRYGMQLPAAAKKLIDDRGNLPPLPDDPRLEKAKHTIIASAALSLAAAKKIGEAEGFEVRVLSDAIEGEAREIGRQHAALMREIADQRPLDRPVLILSGGETTVTLVASNGPPGKGGRNGEYVLSLANGIAGMKNVLALGADTDGRDGSEHNAGAFADGLSMARLAALGMDGMHVLDEHNSWAAFNAVDDLFVTGPTGTNVNDFRALIIY